jgi:hypothetical protein
LFALHSVRAGQSAFVRQGATQTFAPMQNAPGAAEAQSASAVQALTH